MTYNDPRDPNYRREQPPQTRAYSQPNDYSSGYDHGGYQQGRHDPDQYTAGQYTAAQYGQQPEPRKPRRPGPDVDPLMFCGGVLMTGIVTGLAAWLAAWVIRVIAEKVNSTHTFDGIWTPLAAGQDEWWFAIAGFIAALAGGALWYLLQIVTPTPNQFYSWIVGLLVAAAVLLPLLLSQQIAEGIGTAVMHLIIGLPVLTLIPTMGRSSKPRR